MKILVLVSFLLSTTASASVWKAARNWTEQDEVKFSLFLQNEWAADIFSDPQSDYYGIKTDCADAVYAARIVFSAREGLPVRFSDVTKSGSYLTHEMSRWDGLAPLERIRKFISYVGDLVSTLTLETDTYPVAIDKNYFRPGVIFLSPLLSDFERRATGFHGGHAEYVKNIDDIGFVEAIASTSPKAVRTLSLNKNPYVAALVVRGGFRRWRQPQQFGGNVESLAGYSLEQFKIAGWAPLKLISRRQIYQWHEAIRRTLRTRVPSFDERVDIVVDGICSLLTTRTELVQQGWGEVTKNGGRCLSADLAKQYSTDSRDQRILGSYFQLGDLYDWKKRENGNDILGSVEDAQGKLERCSIEYWPGRSMNTWEIYPLVRDGLLESSANYAPAVRWGFRPKGSRDCR